MSELAPLCSGELDEAYLEAALARAGIAAPRGFLEREQLHGGRTGAPVWRVRTGSASYVVKIIPEDRWRGEGTSCPNGGEARLWLSGLTRALPAIRWPVLDTAVDAQGRYWMLMRDVGAGIRPRGRFTRDDSRQLFEALATMHSDFFDRDELVRAPLPDTGGTLRVFTEPLLHLAGRREGEPWIEAFHEGFQVMGAFAPLFFDLIGATWAERFLALVEDDAWKARLTALPSTLLQGDPRRANVSFADGHIDLIDWEFAARGAPGCDLQWHCFLHYWAYPPDGSVAGDDCDDLAAHYAAALGDAAGSPRDPAELAAGWRLGWIKIVASLAFVLVDPLYPDGGTSEHRARCAALTTRAIQRALDFRDQL